MDHVILIFKPEINQDSEGHSAFGPIRSRYSPTWAMGRRLKNRLPSLLIGDEEVKG